MARKSLGSGTKTKKVHRNEYCRMCAEELAKRNGLVELPGDGPFWAECYDMTEEMYGPEDDPASKYLPVSENRIAGDASLTHAEKMKRVNVIRDERERAYRARKAKQKAAREAAMTPEQRDWVRRNGERIDAWLDSLTAQVAGTVDEAEEEYGVLPSDLFTSAATVVPREVAQRYFDEYLSDAGRIHAHGMGIRLDG